MEQGDKQTTLVAYAINTAPSRHITDEERLYDNGKYVLTDDEPHYRGVTISEKVWEEMQKEEICYVQDLDNKGRWFKFCSPKHLEKWRKMSQKEQENYIPTLEEMGIGKGYSFKIKNGEIRKYKNTLSRLNFVDPYYGYWNTQAECEIFLELQD